MLTDIKYIRVWQRTLEGGSSSGVFNTMFKYESKIILSSYISAIFHAELYGNGDCEIVVSYDQTIQDNVIRPIMGYWENEYWTRDDIVLELCGQSTGVRPEYRLFKVTEVAIENDENNNKTVRITGIGALGWYKDIALARITSLSTVKADALEYIVPEILYLVGYEDSNNFHATPLEHIYRMMILPFGVNGSPRDITVGTDLYCPDLGLWIMQDTSNGTGDALTYAEESIAVQTDASKWMADFMKTYDMGVISFQMEYIASSSGVKAESGAIFDRYVPKIIVSKFRTTSFVFSDADGSFTLSKISVECENSHSQMPLMYGQENESDDAENPQKITGINLASAYLEEHAEGYGISIGGNVMKDGAVYFGQYDINKPKAVKSSYAVEHVNTDALRKAVCESLKEESRVKGVDYVNKITIEGAINVVDKPDISLGDKVTIRVLNDTFEQDATIIGLTYVSEGDGFKVEVEYA